MSKVIVGLSGGVDSAVTAYLLKEAGYEVIAITLRTSEFTEVEDARQIASKLNIEFHAPDVCGLFDEKVKQPFFDAYLHGRTPNPCVICNRLVKWDRLLYYAESFGAEAVATGHYASVIQLPNGRYTVQQAEHIEKDQTYMLYNLTQDQLAHTLMPLGKYSKPDVRSIAGQIGLDVAQKKDSQEICFITEGSYADYIEKNPQFSVPGEGNFVSEDGKILGRHKGIIHYTVGQRKGLIVAGYPIYVKQIKSETNEVVLGKEGSLYTSEIACDHLNFMSIPEPAAGESFRAMVKIRFHHKGELATVNKESEDRVRIIFDSPVRAAAPGQSAVFSDEANCIIGGGIITESF
jgi:tRNA-specific 2-thiouridylase